MVAPVDSAPIIPIFGNSTNPVETPYNQETEEVQAN
jgi:hypothetical protein